MEPVRGGSRPSRRLKLSVAALMALASMLALSQWASAQIAVGEIKGSISPGGSQVNARFHGYMVFMDTNAKAFSPVVTLPVSLCGHGKTSLTPVYEWVQSTAVFLAINGSFFDPETEYKPGDCRQAFGPVRSNYLDLAPSIKRPDDKGNPALLFGSNGAPRIVMAMPGDVKASRSVLGAQWEGSPIDHQNGSLLIENGILKGDTALPEATTAAARTAVGLTSGGILIIIAVEKNLPDSEGINCRISLHCFRHSALSMPLTSTEAGRPQ